MTSWSKWKPNACSFWFGCLACEPRWLATAPEHHQKKTYPLEHSRHPHSVGLPSKWTAQSSIFLHGRYMLQSHPILSMSSSNFWVLKLSFGPYKTPHFRRINRSSSQDISKNLHRQLGSSPISFHQCDGVVAAKQEWRDSLVWSLHWTPFDLRGSVHDCKRHLGRPWCKEGTARLESGGNVSAAS